MENKMYAKHQYKCAICGTVFDDLRERVKCESACLKRQEDEAKKAEALKKAAEQAARKAEVDEAFTHAIQLKNAYLKDYDTYEYTYETITNTFENINGEWPGLKALLHFLP